MGELRRQGQKYNAARNHLKALQSENGVLSRTIEVLNHKLSKEKDKLKQLEEAHGVSGFAELQSRLEEVSGQKQKKDEEKGQTMEDISRMVQELNSKIEAKREVIEPLLNRVRQFRARSCSDKKAAYQRKSRFPYKAGYSREFAFTPRSTSRRRYLARGFESETPGVRNAI